MRHQTLNQTLILRITTRYSSHSDKHTAPCRQSSTALEISVGNIKIAQFCQTSTQEIMLPYPDSKEFKTTVSVAFKKLLFRYLT